MADQLPPIATPPPPKVNEQLIESRSQWLSQLLSEHPEFLAMRERALPLAGGYSFANVTHTQKVSDISQMDRHTILELISQHLYAIGMYRTAEILARESGHVFQKSDQPWERTDLHLLVSLAVGHREDAWNLPVDVDHKYVEETFDEDLLAAPYREDPLSIQDELYDPTLHVTYDASGQKALSNIRTCSLKRLVVTLATTDVSDEDRHMFFLALNSLTSATHFMEHLVTLYDMEIDKARLTLSGCPAEPLGVCRNILLLLKKWINFRMSKRILELVRQFASRALNEPKRCDPEKELSGILKMLVKQTGQEKEYDPLAMEAPVISNALRLFAPNLGLFDPDAIEVARQITLICHEKFASVHPLEFIIAISNRATTVRTPTLAEFFEFGDSLTLIVAETFLNTEKKSFAFERILAIARQLAELNNLDALACIVRFLRRPEVWFFGKGVELDDLWARSGEADRKATERPTPYDLAIQKQFEKWGTTIPNMHVELKSGVKGPREPDYVDGLLNWGKVVPHAKRCLVLNRFQTKQYPFTVIPQIQKVILKGAESSAVALQERLDELGRVSGKE